MPLYEFICNDCSKPFEELVQTTSKISEVTCPACESQNITRKISSFASKLSGGGSFSLGGVSGSSCNTGSV